MRRLAPTLELMFSRVHYAGARTHDTGSASSARVNRQSRRVRNEINQETAAGSWTDYGEKLSSGTYEDHMVWMQAPEP